MIYFIAGLHNSRFSDNLQNSWRALSRSDTRLLVVETGDGVGAWKGPGVVLREDEPGVVPYLRLATQYLRDVSEEGDWFARLDADDFYGPGYLAELDSVIASGAFASGISSIYVRSETDQLYFCQSIRAGTSAVGGTLAGQISKMLDFESTADPWGEDVDWCLRMKERGTPITPRPSVGYSMRRWPDHEHTYPVSGDDLPHLWNCKPYHLGAWSEEKVSKRFSPKEEPITINVRRAVEASRKMRDASLAWRKVR